VAINKSFHPTRKNSDRLPPGQYEVKDFPVLSLGPTPKVSENEFKLTVSGLVENPISWTFEELQKLPIVEIEKDIHCVTKWSKFDTHWSGVWLDEIIKIVGLKESAHYLVARSSDGYSTNLPLSDVTDHQALVALAYEGKPIESEHGGPVRLVVPHLYFWKSAKWLSGLEFVDHDEPGFWETRGYHNNGDPWKEERYSFDI